jgi:hypothetical protein
VKITPIAAASIIPATVAGLAITITTLATGVPPAAASAVHAPTAVHARTVPAHRAAATHPLAAATHPAAAAATHPAVAAAQPPVPKPAPAPQQPAPQMTAAETSFEQCVAWRESGNNPTASSAGLFGILPATWSQLGFPGTAGQASVALQKVAFDKLYKELGTSPWAQYDGC